MHVSRAFFKILFTAVFLLSTATCFFTCVHCRYDTINSHLTQIFMCVTGDVKIMLLDRPGCGLVVEINLLAKDFYYFHFI